MSPMECIRLITGYIDQAGRVSGRQVSSQAAGLMRGLKHLDLAIKARVPYLHLVWVSGIDRKPVRAIDPIDGMIIRNAHSLPIGGVGLRGVGLSYDSELFSRVSPPLFT